MKAKPVCPWCGRNAKLVLHGEIICGFCIWGGPVKPIHPRRAAADGYWSEAKVQELLAKIRVAIRDGNWEAFDRLVGVTQVLDIRRLSVQDLRRTKVQPFKGKP